MGRVRLERCLMSGVHPLTDVLMYRVHPGAKTSVLRDLVRVYAGTNGRCIVFTETKGTHLLSAYVEMLRIPFNGSFLVCSVQWPPATWQAHSRGPWYAPQVRDDDAFSCVFSWLDVLTGAAWGHSSIDSRKDARGFPQGPRPSASGHRRGCQRARHPRGVLLRCSSCVFRMMYMC